jgi:hypothetical protein
VLVANAAPAFVIPILLSAASVDARCLQVPICIAADPDLAICRRDRELANARECRRVVDALAIRLDVKKAGAGTPTRDAGFGVAGKP